MILAMTASKSNPPAIDLNFQNRLFLIVLFAFGGALRTNCIVAIPPVAEFDAFFLENLSQRFHFSALDSALRL